MFVGHYSVSFAASRSGVYLPLWVWFLAVQWLDLVFMTLVLAGVEKVRVTEGFTESNDLDLYFMPFSHGLVGSLVMSVIFAAIVAAVFPAARKPLGFALVALASFSHWLLDLLMHTPDLPIYDDDSTKVGLGLWDHAAIALPLELLVLVLGAWIYTRAAGFSDRGKRSRLGIRRAARRLPAVRALRPDVGVPDRVRHHRARGLHRPRGDRRVGRTPNPPDVCRLTTMS